MNVWNTSIRIWYATYITCKIKLYSRNTHAVSKKVLRWRMGPSVDKHLWKTHHVPLHGSNPYQFWFTVDMADSAERKEYWLLDTLSNFKVASHHKSPVTGIVIVKFVVRYKSWLLPRKSNKSMRYAVLCGKISLWTYFATQWDDLATGRSMPSVPHCSFMAAIWPLIKGWAWRNHDGATRLLGLALSKTDWLLRHRARACLILPEDPCIVTLHPHEIGPNSPRSPFWRELLAAPGGTDASLAPGITTSFASLQLWTALPPSPLVQHQPGRPSLRMAPPTAWFMQKATAEKSSEGKKQTFPAMLLQ